MTGEDGNDDFSGPAILVVEDDYFLANDMAHAILRAGGKVLGPAPDSITGMAIVARDPVDAAILDIQLGEHRSFSLAADLMRRGVPIAFVTGYDNWFLPDDLKSVPVFTKPANADEVVRAMLDLLPLKAGR